MSDNRCTFVARFNDMEARRLGVMSGIYRCTLLDGHEDSHQCLERLDQYAEVDENAALRSRVKTLEAALRRIDQIPLSRTGTWHDDVEAMRDEARRALGEEEGK